MKTVALSLFISSGCTAFAPASFGRSRSHSALHVSAVRDLIHKKTKKPNEADSWAQLIEAFETMTPESVGVQGPGIQSFSPAKGVSSTTKRSQPRHKNRQKRRKHNFQERPHLQEEPDLDFFTLHSSAVSHLHKGMPVNDIVRAIKRAQNLHDKHDLETIASFLIDNYDERLGFGYRGSLLSRLAVAALHSGEIEIASRAIETRRFYERASMLPHESAAIVRGLMRVGQVQKGWQVLNDELSLPLKGSSLDDDASRDNLKHLVQTLSSIASRHFYQGEPYIAARALSKLGSLGSVVAEAEARMEVGDFNIPWEKLVTSATVCSDKLMRNGWDVKHISGKLILSPDLTELVWEAMYQFPCPGDEEECALEDYLAAASP